MYYHKNNCLKREASLENSESYIYLHLSVGISFQMYLGIIIV